MEFSLNTVSPICLQELELYLQKFLFGREEEKNKSVKTSCTLKVAFRRCNKSQTLHFYSLKHGL